MEELAGLAGGGMPAGGVTGGASGDIYTTTNSTNTANSGFTGGTYNFGSNNGVPSWAIVAIGLAVLWFFFKK
ncbi:hypothetical protein [Aliivibrio logei]|nr:hypothetical protein [Aliivibrio logei]